MTSHGTILSAARRGIACAAACVLTATAVPQSKPQDSEILPGLNQAAPVSRATGSGVGGPTTARPAPAAPMETAAPPTPRSAQPRTQSTGPESVIMEWPTGRKLVALTYDDGPHPTITPKLIALLKQKNVKATFFLLGEQVKAYPKVAAMLNDPDFEVANHSFNHPQLTKLSAEEIRSQLQRTENAIKEATGLQSAVMRPPYGAQNELVRKVCAEMGLRVVNWDVDTNDWRKRPASVMTKFIMENTGDGSIILFHDRYQASLDTTAEVIDRLRAKGYQFVTVSELLSYPMVRPVRTPAPRAEASRPAEKKTEPQTP